MTQHILVVEDEALIRDVVSEALRDDDYAVSEACDGDEAVRLIDGETEFDALVTDVRMPGKTDGIALAIHARQVRPDIPIVIVSAHDESSRARCLGPHVAFLIKPFRFGKLLTVLWELLNFGKPVSPPSC